MTHPTTAAEMGIWRPNGVGGFVADASAINAQGGGRKVTLPGLSLRIADLDWAGAATRDVNGKIVCWSRTVGATRFVILNDINHHREESVSKNS
jgi:hypothetical protein